MELTVNMDVLPRGLKRTDIEKLPTKSFSRGDLASSDPVPECNICLSKYRNGDRLRVLQCMHQFHARCIDCWLAVSTPGA